MAKAILKTWLQVTVAEAVSQPKNYGNARRMLTVVLTKRRPVLTAVKWQTDGPVPRSDNY